MNNRMISLACALLMALVSILPACAEQASADFTFAGFDGKDTFRQWSDNAFFQEMERRTGVSLAFRQYETEEQWVAAKAAMKAGQDDLPDALFKASLTREEEQRLYDAGVLLDLKPLLDAECPNLVKLLEARPEYLEAISLPGGQIVSLPYMTTAAAQNCMWINQTWLDKLKLAAPTDLEGFEAVLRAFKTRDPNGNGRTDEVPLAFLGIFDLKFLSHAFGFIMNDYNLYASDGQAVYAPATDAYIDMIRWLRGAYAEGLLDQNGFYTNDSLRQVTSANTAQTYGIFFNTSLTNLIPSDWIGDYRLMMPLAADGVQRYRSLWSSIVPGTFAITTACADPGRLLRWVDTLYTEEGAILGSLGQENVDYVFDGDGTWRLTDKVSGNSSYTAEALINSGAVPPGISADEFQTRYSDANIARIVTDTLAINKLCELPFPDIHLTAEQTARVIALQNKLGLEVDLQSGRWIIGEDELTDASVAAFREKLDSLGLPEFMSFWQQLLDQSKGA